MTAILGISALYHDSAAALVVDGRIVAAAQEERFTRVKHDPSFPTHAIAYCLREAGLTPGELDYVGFYDKPLLKFDRFLETHLAFAPVGFLSFVNSVPAYLKTHLHVRRRIGRELPGYRRQVVFPEHHVSHAASAFFPSPFENAAVLTVDGVGEWATATYGTGNANRIELTHELRFPHSPGLLYSAFTYYCGFKVNSGEYKLMGLAPYGEPKYVEPILEKLIDLKPDGSFRMDQKYFRYAQGLRMTSRHFHRLFGGPPRRPEAPLEQRHMDLAASIQAVMEEILLRMARHVHEQTGRRHLCMAGGVALNCVANGRILREGPFDGLWVQPAAGDAGGALGVALLIWYQLLENARVPAGTDFQCGSLLGPAFSEEQIETFLRQQGAVFRRFDDETQLCDCVAELLARGKVVGWFQGRMEFGPRALGARSILGDARSPTMQSVMNRKIKFRESFRPFAPSVLREHAAEYFDIAPQVESPYMLLVAPVAERHRRSLTTEERRLRGLQRLGVVRSTIPAVTHVDDSARLQTVDEQRHGRYYRLIRRFYEKTGCPVIINTSFNVRGEPIVCTPQDAYQCFMATNMDALVLQRCVLLKEEQPAAQRHAIDEYLARFQLD
ncbi:MAG: hypothetical protein D6725_03500 [Planctomycetota bacterium]|nr:MAG: hypothetical protein D6725_03500 [Planctomycetota bacterium]